MRTQFPPDVVSQEYAKSYADDQFKDLAEVEVELQCIASRCGREMSGMKVLDLCGGPGQFSILLAKRGAHVVWHDPSPSYLEIARRKCEEFNVKVEFNLGGFDALSKYKANSFDLVFSRVSWYYAEDEWKTLLEIARILTPRGFFWLHTHNRRFIEGAKNPMIRYIHLVCFSIHELSGWKLCHVPASSKRLKRWLFGKGMFQCLFEEEIGNRFMFLSQKSSS